MKKYFNTAADCKPDVHYMVDVSSRLDEIKGYVDRGAYFTINRARQYGKTTILRALADYLKEWYYVISLDFQNQMSSAKFRDENTFSKAFAKAFVREAERVFPKIPELDYMKTAAWEDCGQLELVELFQLLSQLCGVSDKPLVLIIDEVDSAADNQVFLDFLAQLRGYYIDRDRNPAFQSVILAGVYDVKHLRRKIRRGEGTAGNSPWNIAADFLVNLSFSSGEIAGMLSEYEGDHQTGMDVCQMARQICDYTSGYPFLVSRLCKLLDERISGSSGFPDKKSAWTHQGFLEAVRILLGEKNTLFESLTGKLHDYPELREVLYLLLFQGQSILYNPDDDVQDMALMFGFVKVDREAVVVSNRIFETRLYNMFLMVPEVTGDGMYKAALRGRNQFIQNGRLNMALVLERFVVHFDEIYGDRGERFVEEDGRRYFLLYLKPIINGTGNYYIESRTRNMERTDVIIDYGGEQFVIETKIWHGNAYNTRGEEQLMGYLDHYHLNKGYMLSFNFNKKKEVGVKEIILGDKILIEGVC